MGIEWFWDVGKVGSKNIDRDPEKAKKHGLIQNTVLELVIKTQKNDTHAHFLCSRQKGAPVCVKHIHIEI